MNLRKRLYLVLGLVLMMGLVGGGMAMASSPSGSVGSASGSSGGIYDGAELLDQASISLQEAISAAQSGASGNIGEIDLEMYQGRLVFNVDVGDLDVKVDAENGTVLGQEKEEAHDGDDDD